MQIVDLIRNDLNQISKLNTVSVPKLMVVESYATVHQLVTTVTSKIRDDLSAVDALMRTFPPGSMTGAPKLRTVQIIEKLEKEPRGVYSGVLGFFSVCGSADFNVVIRSAIFNQKGRKSLELDCNYTEVSVGAGGAVVALSDPQGEYDEMVLKAESILPSLRYVYKNHLF
jgi:para-aminobenzoate synthetase